jgi:hypothetical protein
MLASGLPEIVADGEDLARFLTSSGQFNIQMVKPAAFLPSIRGRETSVFRHGSEPLEALWTIGDAHLARFHGAAIVKVQDVRAALLDVIADEPPPRHAAIRGWPGSTTIRWSKRPSRRGGPYKSPARPCCCGGN